MAKAKRKPSPAVLLGRVAAALTACEQAGMAVKLRHGVVMTHHGYVLPTSRGWVARTRLYTEFSPPPSDDD